MNLMIGDASQIMPWIPAAATIAAAAVAGIAGYVTSALRVREVKLTYEQRIRDSYLENARAVAPEVYIPLSQAIWNLRSAYEALRVHIDIKKAEAPIGAKNQFKGVARKFEETLSGIMSRGGSAYLTLSIEYELNNFRSFLLESMEAKELKVLNSFTANFYGALTTFNFYSKKNSISIFANLASANLRIPGIYLVTERVLVSAPITSKDFEKRFTELTLTLSSLIKEVTLGSRGSPK